MRLSRLTSQACKPLCPYQMSASSWYYWGLTSRSIWASFDSCHLHRLINCVYSHHAELLSHTALLDGSTACNWPSASRSDDLDEQETWGWDTAESKGYSAPGQCPTAARNCGPCSRIIVDISDDSSSAIWRVPTKWSTWAICHLLNNFCIFRRILWLQSPDKDITAIKKLPQALQLASQLQKG